MFGLLCNHTADQRQERGGQHQSCNVGESLQSCRPWLRPYQAWPLLKEETERRGALCEEKEEQGGLDCLRDMENVLMVF